MELIRSVSSPGVAFVAVVLCGNAEVVGVPSWRLAIPSSIVELTGKEPIDRTE